MAEVAEQSSSNMDMVFFNMKGQNCDLVLVSNASKIPVIHVRNNLISIVLKSLSIRKVQRN